MTELLLVLQVAVALAFGALAVRSAASWILQTDRRHGYLALALGSLALVILISPILGGGGVEAQALTDMALILFLLSGYALLMFRDAFVPFTSRTRRIIAAVIVLVGAFGIAVQLPAEPSPTIAVGDDTSRSAGRSHTAAGIAASTGPEPFASVPPPEPPPQATQPTQPTTSEIQRMLGSSHTDDRAMPLRRHGRGWRKSCGYARRLRFVSAR